MTVAAYLFLLNGTPDCITEQPRKERIGVPLDLKTVQSPGIVSTSIFLLKDYWTGVQAAKVRNQFKDGFCQGVKNMRMS